MNKEYRYPLIWLMQVTDNPNTFVYQGHVAQPRSVNYSFWTLTLDTSVDPFKITIHCDLTWLTEQVPPGEFHDIEAAKRWCEVQTSKVLNHTLVRNPAPHAAAPQPVTKSITATYLESVEVSREQVKALDVFFTEAAALAVKWERNAETMGVRTIDANGHLLFRNELEAIIPDTMKPLFAQLKDKARRLYHEKEVRQEEQARRRREAAEKESQGEISGQAQQG